MYSSPSKHTINRIVTPLTNPHRLSPTTQRPRKCASCVVVVSLSSHCLSPHYLPTLHSTFLFVSPSAEACNNPPPSSIQLNPKFPIGSQSHPPVHTAPSSQQPSRIFSCSVCCLDYLTLPTPNLLSSLHDDHTTPDTARSCTIRSCLHETRVQVHPRSLRCRRTRPSTE